MRIEEYHSNFTIVWISVNYTCQSPLTIVFTCNKSWYLLSLKLSFLLSALFLFESGWKEVWSDPYYIFKLRNEGIELVCSRDCSRVLKTFICYYKKPTTTIVLVTCSCHNYTEFNFYWILFLHALGVNYDKVLKIQILNNYLNTLIPHSGGIGTHSVYVNFPSEFKANDAWCEAMYLS